MKSHGQKSTEQLIAEFIAKGGVIKICRPKRAPVRRKNSKQSVSIEIVRDAIRSSRAA